MDVGLGFQPLRNHCFCLLSMEPLYLALYQITDFAVKKCNILGFVTFTVRTGLHEGVSNYVELDVALK